MPSLLAHGFFWKGWLHIIREVVGYPALIAALLGVVAAPAGAARGLLVGLWGGYFALGLVFSLHVHTHDYYSLPLAPIVGLSLAPLGGAALALIARRADRVPWRWAAAAAIALAVALTLREARWRLAPPGIAREVEIARRIGELTGHTERALILDPFFGKAIQYHGALSGIPWPRPTDAGPLGASPWGEAEVRAWMEALRESFDPTHFILTDFNALEDQPGLRTHLDAAYPSVASEGGFAIWDLREKDASGAMKN
jgi:hypothetical protein